MCAPFGQTISLSNPSLLRIRGAEGLARPSHCPCPALMVPCAYDQSHGSWHFNVLLHAHHALLHINSFPLFPFAQYLSISSKTHTWLDLMFSRHTVI